MILCSSCVNLNVLINLSSNFVSEQPCGHGKVYHLYATQYVICFVICNCQKKSDITIKMSSHNNVCLRPDPRLDSKWSSTDIGVMFTSEGLSKLWNEMAMDGELSVWPHSDLDSTSGSGDDTNLSSDNNTGSGTQLPQLAPGEARSSQVMMIIMMMIMMMMMMCSKDMIASWAWSEQPSEQQLGQCLDTIISEQVSLVVIMIMMILMMM